MRNVTRLAVLLLLSGCGQEVPFDADVTFAVQTSDGVTTQPTRTALEARKAGKTQLVDARADKAPPGTISGRHSFPPGVTAPGIVAYYEGLLRNAGWGEEDFRADRDAGRIYLLAVSGSGGSSDGSEVDVRTKGEYR
jgi:hypothetical protein